MQDIYIIGQSIISALGNSLEQNMDNISNSNGGVKTQHIPSISNTALPIATIDWKSLESKFLSMNLGDKYTSFEKLMIIAVEDAISNTSIDIKSDKTLFLISTTKGNIDLLDSGTASKYNEDRVHLWSSAEMITDYFGNKNEVIIISNACVSGVMGIITAAEYLRNDDYNHAVVIGGDILSKFVVSGFQSFQSLSSEPCKPYDANRDGLNLGEAAGCLILSKTKTSDIKVLSGASHNDANHISGPSRTAEGMYYAVKDALKYSEVEANEIDAISAHGTATPYNDEMEAIGLDRLGMIDIPVHSLKGFWGHTLGAAGIIETAALVWSMRNNKILPTLGYLEKGVSKDVIISKKIEDKPIQFALKIASGFSGINSALVLKKEGESL